MGDMADYYMDADMFRPSPAEMRKRRRVGKREQEEFEKHKDDPLYWHSQDGRLKPITDMDDKHLLNTIAWLDRKGAASLPALLEGANAEDTLIALTQIKILGFRPLVVLRYQNLLKEFERREEKKRAEEAANNPEPAAR